MGMKYVNILNNNNINNYVEKRFNNKDMIIIKMKFNLHKCEEEDDETCPYDNVILIPFRNRDQHLQYFMKNTIPLFQEYLPKTKVVVIEQKEGKLFNRGALLNVGFKEYEKKTKYFFTHDVDLNPTKKCVQEFYTKIPVEHQVLGIYTSRCNTLGGIIKVKDHTIQKVNGFPNNIWGWGTEDKALQNRTEYYNILKISILTDDREHPHYIRRFNDVNDQDHTNLIEKSKHHYDDFPKLTRQEKLQEIMISGLNNLEYTILERKNIHDMVELIKVDI